MNSTTRTAAPSTPSSAHIIRQLIRKDVYLHRWHLAGALLAGLVALALMAGGSGVTFYMGGVLLATVLIAHGVTLVIFTVVEERQQRTLPFIMSLPVSNRDFALAKLSANLVIFGTTWAVLFLAAVALIGSSPHLANGLVTYATILFTELLLSTCCILAVAMVTRSLPWTLGTMLVGNLVFNGFVFYVFNLPTLVATVQSPRTLWPPVALQILGAEWLAISLVLIAAYAVSIRRKDVL